MPDDKIKPVGELKPFYSESKEIKPVGELKPYNPNNSDFYQNAMGTDIYNQDSPDDNERLSKIDNAVEAIPGIDDGRPDVEARKDIIRQLALKKAPYEVIRQAMDVVTGKDPKQAGAGNYKYYVKEDGVPVALAPGERPPKEYRVASLYGTQKEAEDDSFFTSAVKHAWNGLTKGAEGFADLGNLISTLSTGEESENMNSLKNAAETLRLPTKSSENAPIYKGDGEFDFNFDNVSGNILNGMESVISFTLGTKGFGTAIKSAKGLTKGAVELTKLQSKAAAAAGAYNMAVGEMMDVADSAGLEGRNKGAFAAVAAVPQAILESMFGAEGFISDLMAKNPAAKAELNQLTSSLIKNISKDAAGNITKEGIDQLSKEMTVVAGSLFKKYGKNFIGSVAEEAITEPLQDFTSKASQKLYNTLVEDKFKDADLFTPEALNGYINSSIAGALGSFGPSAVLSGPAAAQQIAQQRDEAQSKNVFYAVSKGNEAVSALKTNITNAFNDGDITQDEYNAAITRINAYKDYNEIVTSNELNLDEPKKLEVFEKTFQKQNLEAQIEAMGNPEKMNPINLAEYKAKEKMADDIQKDINQIIVNSRVKDEPVAGKKTVNDAQKSEQEPVQPKKESTPAKKPNVDPRLQALMDRFGKKDIGIKVEEGKRYEDIPAPKFNDKSFNARDKHSVTAEYVSRQPEKKISGVITEREFPIPKKSNPKQLNTVYGFEMPDGKVIRFASSMERDEGFRGHTMEERLRDAEAVGTPVGMKYVWLEGDKDSPARPALKIFHGKTGKFLGWAKATNTGKEKPSPKQIEQLENEQTIDETPIAPQETISKPTKPPVNPTPEVKAGVEAEVKPVTVTVNKIKPIGQLGNGSNIYFKSDKYRVNEDSKSGKYFLNIQNQSDIVPIANIKFESPEDAVKIAKELQDKFPKGVPDAILIDKYIDDLKKQLLENKEKPSIIQKAKEAITNLINPNEQKPTTPTDNGKGISITGNTQAVSPNAEQKSESGKEETQGEKSFDQKLKDIKKTINRYNEIPLKRRNEPEVVEVLYKLLNEVKEIGYGTGRTKGKKIQLFDDKGNRIMTKPKSAPRSKEAIEEEKRDKELLKKALRAEPQSIAHQVMMDVANGVMFSRKAFTAATGEKELPSFIFTDTKGARSIEFYFQELAEAGLFISEYAENNQQEITQEVIKGLMPYAVDGGREIAKEDAILEYEKINNLGLANAEVQRMIEQGEEVEKLKEQNQGIADAENGGYLDEFADGYEALNELPDDVLIEMSKNEDMFNEWYDAVAGGKEKFIEDNINKLKEESALSADESFYRSYFSAKYDRISQQGQLQKQSSYNTEIQNLQKVMDLVKKTFKGYEVIFNPKMPYAGKLSGKVISINPYYAGTDTPIHEGGHILIDMMGYENDVIQAAIKQLKGTELWDETAQRYPELSPEMLAKEVLAEAIGREGQGIFKTESEKSSFKSYLDYIFDWIKRKLGLDKNIAKSLARQVISGRGISQSEVSDSLKDIETIKPKAETVSKFAKSLEYLEKIKETDGSSKKRKLKTERDEFLDKNPDIRYIENNIRSIVRQLENKGLVITKGDCF